MSELDWTSKIIDISFNDGTEVKFEVNDGVLTMITHRDTDPFPASAWTSDTDLYNPKGLASYNDTSQNLGTQNRGFIQND